MDKILQNQKFQWCFFDGSNTESLQKRLLLRHEFGWQNWTRNSFCPPEVVQLSDKRGLIYLYNSTQYQNLMSVLCSYYCQYCINESSRHKDYYDVINHFHKLAPIIMKNWSNTTSKICNHMYIWEHLMVIVTLKKIWKAMMENGVGSGLQDPLVLKEFRVQKVIPVLNDQ